MALNLLSAAGTAVSAVIGVLAAGIVAFTLVRHYVRKKQGKGGCGCDCSSCCGCPSRAPEQKERGKKKTDHTGITSK